jgi:hypothetical protein
MRHQPQNKLAMVKLPNTRADPGTVVVEFHHATTAAIAVFYPVAFQALALAAELLQG